LKTVVEHLERRLGQLSAGWKTYESDNRKIHVCKFQNGAVANVTSFSTVGLSLFPVRTDGIDREFQFEIMGCQYAHDLDDGDGPWPGVLEALSTHYARTGVLLRRGETVRLPGPMAERSDMTAVYAALPTYFDDDFKSLTDDRGQRVAIVWLIPISASEADYVTTQGWQRFEHILVKKNPDVPDLRRPSTVGQT
jgi:hypothetical protein